jgi:plasmid maintenance system antidote protein VapI
MNGNKLKAKIIERGLNVEGFASLINMDRSSLYRKLNYAQRITIGEATRIKEALGMTNEEASDIFFG